MGIDTVRVQNRILYIKEYINRVLIPQGTYRSHCALPCHRHEIHRRALRSLPDLISHTVDLRRAIGGSNLLWFRDFIPRMFFQISVRINHRIIRLFRGIIAAEQTRKTLASPAVCIVDAPESYTGNGVRMLPVYLEQLRIHLCLRNFLLLRKP